jgi:hypothetical protein
LLPDVPVPLDTSLLMKALNLSSSPLFKGAQTFVVAVVEGRSCSKLLFVGRACAA